ncbi:MAG: hypothetical protein MN733_35375 [Nitrososphaera sp.]|nr:hypothetical protein [Nitrososphaera sp.]
MLVKVDSDLTREAMAVGRENHYRFRPVPQVKELDIPLYLNEWWFIPAEEDKSVIPGDAWRRVGTLEKAGLGIKQVIIAHEAPRLLAAPPKPSRVPELMASGKVTAITLVKVATVLTAFAFWLGINAIIAAGSLVMIDPAMIVILEDGSAVEVMTWYE